MRSATAGGEMRRNRRASSSESTFHSVPARHQANGLSGYWPFWAEMPCPRSDEQAPDLDAKFASSKHLCTSIQIMIGGIRRPFRPLLISRGPGARIGRIRRSPDCPRLDLPCELATQNAQMVAPTQLSYLGVVLSLTPGFGGTEHRVDRHLPKPVRSAETRDREKKEARRIP